MMRGLAVLLVSVLALSGCGLRGNLERPPPMFGSARAAYDAEQKRKAEEAAAKAAGQTTGEATAAERQTVTIPVTPAEPEVKAPETLQPAPRTSPFQRPN